MRKLWKRPDLTDRQATLIGKTVGQVSEEKDLEETIAGLQQELKELAHYKICEECRIELILNVDRYLGSRGGISIFKMTALGTWVTAAQTHANTR